MKTSMLFPVIILVGHFCYSHGQSLKLLFPNGGEDFKIESYQYISWNSNGVSNIIVELSTDGGVNWIDPPIVTTSASDKFFKWKVPYLESESNNCLIRIRDADNKNLYDVSDKMFKINYITKDFYKIVKKISINKIIQIDKPGNEEITAYWGNYMTFGCGDVYNNGTNTLLLGYSSIYGNYIIFSNYKNNVISFLDTLAIGKAPNSISITDIDNDQLSELVVTTYGNILIYKYKRELHEFLLFADIPGNAFVFDFFSNNNNKELVVQGGDCIKTYDLINKKYMLKDSIYFKEGWLHGLTIGDFDDDGKNEIAVANDNALGWMIKYLDRSYQITNIPIVGGAANASGGHLGFSGGDDILVGSNGGVISLIVNNDLIWQEYIGRLAYNIDIKNIDQDPDCEFCVIHSKTWGYYDGQISLYKKIYDLPHQIWRDSVGYYWGDAKLLDADNDSSEELFVSNADTLIIYKTNSIATRINAESKKEIPLQIQLFQNYPNPFNPTTKINFTLSQNSATRLIIYDLLGREVKTLINNEMQAGYHEVDFNASNLSSGIYFYTLKSGNFIQTKKLVVVK